MGQLHEVDILKVAPLKIVTHDGKSDSTWIKAEDVRLFAAPFLTPIIDSTNLLNLFTESSFMDQTINAITLTYTRSSETFDTLHLRNWDVYIDPVSQTVQRIYILKSELINNHLQTLQLTWKTGAWCKIVTIPQDSSTSHFVKEEIVKWRFD